MISGEIIVNGNAGKNACCGMKGGSVHILGNADDGLCSLPTSMNEGLVDGFIYVQKSVGENSVVRMRRGNIIIGGNIGSGSCLELISGSVVVLGKIGNNVKIGGQAGISGHLRVGNNVEIGGGSGVIKDIPDNAKVMGYPAKSIREFLKDNR